MFYKLENTNREKMMDDFIKKDCVACGGNWSAMIMSGLKNRFWWRYDEMEDREYTFFELVDIVYEEIDEIIKNNLRNNNMYLRERITDRMMERGKVVAEEHRSNAYVGCDTYVVQYLGKLFEIDYVDGMVTALVETDTDRANSLYRKQLLRRYE